MKEKSSLNEVISTLFTAAQQATYLTELECNLQTGEFVVLCDFAENYPFILQDNVHSIRTVHKTPSIHL